MGEIARNVHDVIVIGAGFGGLTAACTLAQAGRDVVVLEAGEEAGGLCRTFSSEGLTWNLSLYSLRGCRPGGPFAALVEELRLSEKIDFTHSPRSYLVKVEGTSLPISMEIEEMLEGAAEFEEQGAGKMRSLLEHIGRFHPQRDYAALSSKTFGEVAAEAGLSGRLRAAFSAPLMVSLGLPPERVSAYFAFLKYRLILESGVSYPQGGPDALVRLLVDKIDEEGGRVRLGEAVEELAIEPGEVKRVTTSKGENLRGRSLVINADATWAIDRLAPHLSPKARSRPQNLRSALSATLLLLKVEKRPFQSVGLDRYPHVIDLAGSDLDGIYRRLREGDVGAPGEVLGLTSPATWSRTEGTSGVLPVTAFFPTAAADTTPTEARHERAREVLGAKAGQVSTAAALGPKDLAAMTANREGSFSGWEMTPDRYGPARIPRKLLPGIYLAGHWTDPGPSLLNAALSGQAAAQAILKK